jgi:hypothetical protein
MISRGNLSQAFDGHTLPLHRHLLASLLARQCKLGALPTCLKSGLFNTFFAVRVAHFRG